MRSRCSSWPRIIFFSTSNQDAILQGDCWIVADQLRIVEPWVPDFVSGTNMDEMTTTWMQLPSLPIKFWSTRRLWGIMGEVGEAH